MPYTYDENLAIAKEISLALSPYMTSSHTIIDRTKLPFAWIHQYENYKNQFGAFTFNQFLRYTKNLEQIRAATEVEAKQYKFSISTGLIATSYFGIGECSELSNRVMLELLLRGYANFSMISLEGNHRAYLHALIILGDCKNLKVGTSLDSFKNIDKDFVYIDLFLNRVGRVNNLKQDLKSYIDAYELTKVCTIDRIDDNDDFFLVMAKEIKKNALAVHAKVAARMKQKYFTFDLSWDGPYYTYHLQHSKTQANLKSQFFAASTLDLAKEDSFFKPKSILCGIDDTVRLTTLSETLGDDTFIPKLKS